MQDANNPKDSFNDNLDKPPPQKVERPGDFDPMYDSTDMSYFGYEPDEDVEGSEEEYERDSRHRAKTNCCYRGFYRLVTSVCFNFFIFILILANTMTLALYRYD